MPLVLHHDNSPIELKRSSHWDAVRDAHLRQFPTCAACGKRALLNVHHIKPFHLFPSLELDGSNLITLCEDQVINCHLLFGHLRSWPAYNPTVVQDAASWYAKMKARLTA